MGYNTLVLANRSIQIIGRGGLRMTQLVDLSISIVSYNTAAYLRHCLRSIYHNIVGISFEVIVVDNGSRDGTAEMLKREFSQVCLITNSENRWFPRAHNQALALAKGRFFLFLNPDTEIPRGTCETLVRFLELNQDVGAVGCQERNRSGLVVRTGSALLTPWIGVLERTTLGSVVRLKQFSYRYHLIDWARDTSRDVEALTNCFLMVRTDLLERCNGLDERFLLYYTDNDLSLRIRNAGFRVHYLADCHYIHHGSRATEQIGKRERERILELDMWKYFGKHFGILTPWLMRLIIWLANTVLGCLIKLYREARYGSRTETSL